MTANALEVQVAVAVLSTVLGIVTAESWHRDSGPVIILKAATGFFLALLKRR